MPFLVIVALLALSFWGVSGTFLRLRRLHAGSVWWLAFASLALLGCIAGWWLAFHFEYQVSPRMRFVSFPMPLAFFHLEEGRWIDFPTPPEIMYPGLVANVAAVIAGSLLPLLLTSALLARRTKHWSQMVNKPGAVNGGMALPFQLDHPWPAVTDPER
jgi:hypothetical protein